MLINRCCRAAAPTPSVLLSPEAQRAAMKEGRKAVADAKRSADSGWARWNRHKKGLSQKGTCIQAVEVGLVHPFGSRARSRTDTQDT